MASSTPPLKPQFFIWRPDGKQVPLIPMDEVPTNVIFHGVPRTLEAKDTTGMISLGLYESRHAHYHVEFAGSRANPFEGLSDISDALTSDHSLIDSTDVPRAEPSVFASKYASPAARSEPDSTDLFPSNRALLDSMLVSTDAPPTDRPMLGSKRAPPADRSLRASKYAPQGLTMDNGYPAPPLAYGIEEQTPSTAIVPKSEHAPWFRGERKATPTAQETIDKEVEEDCLESAPSVDHQPPTPSSPGSSPNVPFKKEYCSHWMRHGECDFAQRGCIYKHVMPTDPNVLAMCGFRDIPPWYRELYGVPSLAAVPGSGAAGGPANIVKKEKMDGNWRTATNDTSKTSTVGTNQGVFKNDGTPTRAASFARPARANGGRFAAPTCKAAVSGTKRVRKPVMNLDQMAAMAAIAQLEKSNAEESKRKANVSARVSHSNAVKVSSRNALATAAGSRSTSRGTDSSANRSDSDMGVNPTPGFNTPITSCESDADTDDQFTPIFKVDSDKGRSPASKTYASAASAASAQPARSTSTPAKGGEEAVRDARSNTGTPKLIVKKPMSQSLTPNGRACTPVSSGSGKVGKMTKTETGDETTDSSNNLNASNCDVEMPMWTPDGYDHDD